MLLTYPSSLNALDLEGAKESSCFEIKKTVPMDIGWVMSQKTWYYPLMSRMDLYMTGIEMSGKSAKELRENELYYDSCPVFSIVDGQFVGTGFDGKVTKFVMKPIKGLEVFEFFSEEGGFMGTCSYTLTDNKTFGVMACCIDKTHMSWGSMSIHPTLPKETVSLIYDHAESLGFKREHFTGLRYDHCGDSKKNQETKNEL